MKKPELKYLEDFYYSPDGFMVFTEAYLLKRGYCCGSGCFHCPYDGISVTNTDAESVNTQLFKIQCPFCFESFSLPVSADEGDTQNFVYDCEVCCNPIDITLQFEGDRVISREIRRSN